MVPERGWMPRSIVLIAGCVFVRVWAVDIIHQADGFNKNSKGNSRKDRRSGNNSAAPLMDAVTR